MTKWTILLENKIPPVLDLVSKNQDDVELLSSPQIRRINVIIWPGKEAVKCKS